MTAAAAPVARTLRRVRLCSLDELPLMTSSCWRGTLAGFPSNPPVRLFDPNPSWSAGSQIGPQALGALRGDGATEELGPLAFAAALRAPGPEAARGKVQRVSGGEADGA